MNNANNAREEERNARLVEAQRAATEKRERSARIERQADDRGLPERLLSCDRDDLSAWLAFIRDQGDVLGAEDV